MVTDKKRASALRKKRYKITQKLKQLLPVDVQPIAFSSGEVENLRVGYGTKRDGTFHYSVVEKKIKSIKGTAWKIEAHRRGRLRLCREYRGIRDISTAQKTSWTDASRYKEVLRVDCDFPPPFFKVRVCFPTDR